MVASAIRTPRVRIGAEAALPLMQRCQLLRERIDKEIPLNHPARAVANQMDSEVAADSMADALAKWKYERAATNVPSGWDHPAWAGARDEMTGLRRRYHAAWSARRELRARLHVAAVSHEILEDLDPGWQHDPPQIFHWQERVPHHDTFDQETAALQAFVPQVLAIESSVVALRQAIEDEQSNDRKLLVAVFRRVVRLEHGRDADRQAIHDLRQQVRDLKRQLQPKQWKKLKARKTRSQTSTKQHEAHSQ
jgi:hypothetical protein